MILPDVLAPGLHAVLCGTAVGRFSAQAQAYYAKPGNRFWPALHESGLVPVRLGPQDYPRVLEFGLGLTDLNKTEFGNDSELTRTAFDVAGLRAKLAHYRPAALAFTSKHGAQTFLRRKVAYGRQPEVVEGAALFVLTSPSGLATGYWSLEPWRELAGFVNARRTRPAAPR
ncbi:mismatch-specific DNA-glycosylase [Zavarzinia sp. CC-PAN008]|uniref:mismatch-specific DNA-glycosylase n=1 Tax=Zavarzinia sp. CC-PAN008 TaxID=3243332 RepID=UPI003F7490AB